MLFDPAKDTWKPADIVRRPAPQPVVPLELLDPERLRRERAFRAEQRRQREEAILAEARQILDARSAELQKQALKLGTMNKARAAIILEQIALEYGVTVHDLKGPWRAVPVCRARMAAYYRIRTETTLSYPSIGKMIGGRDHTTALSGANKHADLHGLPRPGQRRVADCVEA